MCRWIFFLACLAPNLAIAAETAGDSLEGAWECISGLNDRAVEINDPEGERFQLQFHDGKVKWMKDQDEISIPRNGAEFDLRFDRDKFPHRIEMIFYEGGENIWAYGIYQRRGDTLMLKLLLPLVLDNSGQEKNVEQFMKDPFPNDFRPPAEDGPELLMIFRKTDKVIRPEDVKALPAGSFPPIEYKPQ